MCIVRDSKVPEKVTLPFTKQLGSSLCNRLGFSLSERNTGMLVWVGILGG